MYNGSNSQDSAYLTRYKSSSTLVMESAYEIQRIQPANR